MTAEPSKPKSKWMDLEANSALRELAESHQTALLRNISLRKANENSSDAPRKKKARHTTPPRPSSPSEVPTRPTLPSSPRLEPELEVEPGPKRTSTRKPRPKKASSRGPNCSYTFNRDRLPELVSRAKEYVKRWHKPKPLRKSLEAKREKFRSTCCVYTVNHSRGVVDIVKPASSIYIAMEFRKCLVRHDWAGVKKLLKVFLRSNNMIDRVSWKMILTTLFYYPGGEALLREFIEQNRMSYASSDILRGLLEINGMEPFCFSRKLAKPVPVWTLGATVDEEVRVDELVRGLKLVRGTGTSSGTGSGTGGD